MVPFAAGSGVIISADGLVLTNAHVVDGADVIQVQLSDKRTIRADLVGTSPSHDIALVRLRDTTNLVPATLGSSDAMQVGDQVVAIGNALALGDAPTVTTGIVSAKGRTLEDGQTTLKNLIQTDAAINHGNSGGPLLNAAGQVVGINSAGIPDAENLGFAIEIDAIRPLIDELKTGKDAEVKVQAFLGISSADAKQLTPDEANQLGVQGKDGVVVVDVQPQSAASDAGLEGRRHPQAGRRQGRQRAADAPRRHPGPPAGLDHLDRGRSGRPAEDPLGRPRLAAVARPPRRLTPRQRRPTWPGRRAGGSISRPNRPEVRMSIANPATEPPVGHARVIFLGPVSPHWEIDSDFGDRKVVEEFKARALARLVLLPRDDPQFRRNRERIVRDAERERIVLDWDLGLPEGEDI